MVRVSTEANSAASRFLAWVRVRGIRQSLEAARRHYPGDGVGVVFPIEFEAFFERDDPADPIETFWRDAGWR